MNPNNRDLSTSIKIIGVLVILAILVFSLVVYGFYQLLSKLEPQTIQLWAAVASAALIFAVPAISMIGFYFGKVEARGWLAGADQMMERGFKGLVDVVNVRDTSHISVRNQAPTPSPAAPIYLFPSPQFPELSHRGGSERENNNVIDLG